MHLEMGKYSEYVSQNSISAEQLTIKFNMSLLRILIECYFKEVSFELCFESVNVHSQTYVVGKRIPQGRTRARE